MQKVSMEPVRSYKEFFLNKGFLLHCLTKILQTNQKMIHKEPFPLLLIAQGGSFERAFDRFAEQHENQDNRDRQRHR